MLERAAFDRICEQAGLRRAPHPQLDDADLVAPPPLDDSLAQRLVRRRKAVGLSQAALARRAGIRVETLNRIERGKTASPDLATMRKLVAAIQEARVEDR